MSRLPCLAYRPLVTPSTPPQASISPGLPAPPTMSSPVKITVGSRLISRSSASLMACLKLILRGMGGSSDGSVLNLQSVRDVDVGHEIPRGRQGRRLRRGDGLVDQPPHLAIDRFELLRSNDAGLRDAGG